MPYLTLPFNLFLSLIFQVLVIVFDQSHCFVMDVFFTNLTLILVLLTRLFFFLLAIVQVEGFTHRSLLLFIIEAISDLAILLLGFFFFKLWLYFFLIDRSLLIGQFWLGRGWFFLRAL